MTTSLAAALNSLAGDDTIAQLAREISEQAAELRFHEALRRRSREARTAAAVATTTHLANAAGLPPRGDLAAMIVAGQADGTDARWRTWRMLRRSLEYYGALGGTPDRTPAGQLMAALRRDGGLPAPNPAAARHQRIIAALLSAGGPAFVTTALIWAHGQGVGWAGTAGPPASAFGASLAKIHAVRSGLEPAGVAVLDDVGEPEALADYLAGDWQAAATWCEACGLMWRAGLIAGRAVCDDVLAGARGGATTTR